MTTEAIRRVLLSWLLREPEEKVWPGGTKGQVFDGFCCPKHFGLSYGKPWTGKSQFATLAEAEAAMPKLAQESFRSPVVSKPNAKEILKKPKANC